MASCPAWKSCPCLCPGEKGHPRDGCCLLFSWDIGIQHESGENMVLVSDPGSDCSPDTY